MYNLTNYTQQLHISKETADIKQVVPIQQGPTESG